MQRVLAQILKLQPLSPRKTNRQGFCLYSIKVKVKEPACKGYLLPPRTKGRVHNLVREYPLNYEPEMGDDIILTPREVRSLLSAIRIEPVVIDPGPGGLKFTVQLHSPTRRNSRYRLSVPFLGREVEGSISEEEAVTLDLSRELPAGCHRIEVMTRSLRAEAIVPILKPRSVLSYTIDVDGDGFPERIIENDFLRLSLAPHLGARSQSIRLKRSKMDLFTGTFEYGKEDYVEYGGADEHIGDFPGDFWKTKFKEVESTESSVAFSHTFGGMEITRRVELLPSLPLLRHSVLIRRKTGGEKNVLPWHRMVLATDDPSWSSLLHLYTQEKVERVRHTSPASFWRERRDYYGVQTGTAVLQHEESKEVFCFSTHPDSLEFVGSTSARGYHLLTPHFRRKKLKVKEEIEYHYAYILGDDFTLDPHGCFVVCTGPWDGKKRLLAIVGKVDHHSGHVEASLSTGESLELTPTGMEGIGTILSATTEIQAPEKVAVQLKTNHGEYSLEAKETG